MDETEARLARCFAAAFPLLSPDAIVHADAEKIEAWDSVASVTLFATIEEEFGIEMDVQASAELLSFPKILEYLRSEKGSES
jgi:acyl carrier protein